MHSGKWFILTISILVAASIAYAAPETANTATGGKVMKHELPPLPYAYNALEPYYDEATVRLHHDKHHLAYVNGFNAALKKLEEARQKGDFGAVQALSKLAAFHGSGPSTRRKVAGLKVPAPFSVS